MCCGHSSWSEGWALCSQAQTWLPEHLGSQATWIGIWGFFVVNFSNLEVGGFGVQLNPLNTPAPPLEPLVQ